MNFITKNRNAKRFGLLIFIITSFTANIYSETINKVLAVIESKVVTSIDLDNEIKKQRLKSTSNNKKKVLEKLIQSSLIELIAYEESIFVTSDKIQNLIRDKMKSVGILTIKDFSKQIKSQMGISFKTYKEQMKQQIIESEIARIKIPIQPPKIEEVSKWYKKNRKKIGKQYTFHLFELPFKSSKGLKDELRVNKIMKSIQNLAKQNIKLTIKKYQNKKPQIYQGRFTDLRLDEIASKTNPDIALLLQNSIKNGVSDLLRSSKDKKYFFVYLKSSSWVPLENATTFIQKIISSEIRQKKFQKWLINEKKRRNIKIYL